MKKTLTTSLAFLCFLCVGIWHEYVSIQISSKGYYKGTVIDKTPGGSSGSAHYLYVDWDGHGEQSIVVHPITHKRTQEGDRFETEYAYFPIIGAIGTAYVPATGEYGILLALAGMLSKALALGIAISALHKARRKV